MMKKDAVIAVLAGVFGLLMTALAPPGGAAAQPQPTLTLWPSGGPCDAAIQVTGSGFPVPASPLESLGLYLLRPGTVDLNMGILNAASVQADGSFSQGAPLWEHGCEAATLDSQAALPTGNLVIAVRSGQGPVAPGERIPSIIAVAQYAYTTITPRVPTEALTMSPSSGPCDGAVQVTGSGFEPGLEVLLKLGRPGSDDTLGTLGSAVVDPNGHFAVAFALGELGCQAAQLNMTVGNPQRPQIGIGAFRATYPIPPQGIPPVLASVSYVYTTANVSPAPRALPSTGSGPGERSASSRWPLLAASFAAAGLVLLAGWLYRGRRLRG
jgi:hypothetical protein